MIYLKSDSNTLLLQTIKFETFDGISNLQFLLLKAAFRMPLYYISEQDKYVHKYPVKVTMVLHQYCNVIRESFC